MAKKYKLKSKTTKKKRGKTNKRRTNGKAKSKWTQKQNKPTKYQAHTHT